jgi:hypothetical protein
VSDAWPWIAVALLGAYHGVDPSMGWLFAVALGLQERRRGKVFEALLPIAVGHLIAVGLAVALIAGAMASGAWMLRPIGAVALIAFGLFRLWRPGAHPRWVAMRVSARDLVAWSFLMASAHGAGLMLFPILMELPASASGMSVIHHHHMEIGAMAAHGHLGLVQAIAVVLVHTGAMLIVMGTVALAVYQWIGLQILRSAWINLDTIWAIALIAAGFLSLLI